jgi:hypothetical protein
MNVEPAGGYERAASALLAAGMVLLLLGCAIGLGCLMAAFQPAYVPLEQQGYVLPASAAAIQEWMRWAFWGLAIPAAPGLLMALAGIAWKAKQVLDDEA